MGREKLASIGAMAACAMFFGAAPPVHAYVEPRLPKPGVTFLDAKRDLLGQGLTIAPDPRFRAKPREREPGLYCDDGRPAWCEALFLYKRPDGWGDYVVVSVNPVDGRIVEARFAQFADHLLTIPPPEPRDAPKLKGTYFSARKRLRTLGYAPMRTASGEPASVCADTKCKTLVKLPEAQCAMDVPICNTFWLSPNGRVLKVMTVGEIRAGDVYYVTWSSRREQHDLTN